MCMVMSFKNVTQNLSLARNLGGINLIDGETNYMAAVTADKSGNVLFSFNLNIDGTRTPTFVGRMSEDGVEIPHSGIFYVDKDGILQTTFTVLAEKGKTYVYILLMDSGGNDEVIDNGYASWNYF